MSGRTGVYTSVFEAPFEGVKVTVSIEESEASIDGIARGVEQAARGALAQMGDKNWSVAAIEEPPASEDPS